MVATVQMDNSSVVDCVAGTDWFQNSINHAACGVPQKGKVPDAGERLAAGVCEISGVTFHVELVEFEGFLECPQVVRIGSRLSPFSFLTIPRNIHFYPQVSYWRSAILSHLEGMRTVLRTLRRY